MSLQTPEALPPDLAQLRSVAAKAYRLLRERLVERRVLPGYWEGRLADSPLATATAVAALAVYREALAGQRILPRALISHKTPAAVTPPAEGHLCPSANLSGVNTVTGVNTAELIDAGLRYLVATQNPDGGWGDTDRDPANIASTALAMAAVRLAGACERLHPLWTKAEAYFQAQGGAAAVVARYGKDKTFAAPILATCALAGLVPWTMVPQLPFELACLPQRWLGALRIPVVSYALPALVAIGQLRFHAESRHRSVLDMLRRASCRRSLEKVALLQPASGGFLEAVPLTAFVVLSLSAIGHVGHPVVTRGVGFLCEMARTNGAWPVDVNLATWLTSLATAAIGHFSPEDLRLVDVGWLLGCQHRQRHPFTDSPPGGWGWTDRPGAVPDVDDTSGALLALATLRAHIGSGTVGKVGGDRNAAESTAESDKLLRQLDEAAIAGLTWLEQLQNSDGGWPTFCRGWGKLPFDRSAVDLTAHAVRAFAAWLSIVNKLQQPAEQSDSPLSTLRPETIRKWHKALRRGVRFLCRRQRPDGGWEPLWFGNAFLSEERNLVYGTSRAILALLEVLPPHDSRISRGVEFLCAMQHPDGGWGAQPPDGSRKEVGPRRPDRRNAVGPTADVDPFAEDACELLPTVEETAWAVEALAEYLRRADPIPNKPLACLRKGVAALVRMIGDATELPPAPVGLYFARLWYYEELYPVIFSLAALGRFLWLSQGAQ